MIFKKGAQAGAIEIEREQGEDVMYFNYLSLPMVPNISENADIMGSVIDALAENPAVSRMVFVQQRNYNYDSKKVLLLSEIARLYNFLSKQEAILTPEKLSLFGNIPEVQNEIVYLLSLLRKDPIGCYNELQKTINYLRTQLEGGQVRNKSALVNYIRFIERFRSLLEATKLIQEVVELLPEFSSGREIYSEIFRPDILPNFTFTRLVSQFPKDAEFVDQYEVSNEQERAIVTILKQKNDSKFFYHIMPAEYSLSEEHHLLVNIVRNVLSEHRPEAKELVDTERTRTVFFNIARDMLTDLAREKGFVLTNRELVRLATILVRHTIGFGLIEILLLDEKLQDIVLNAPIAQNPVFVRHEKYDECVTNIIPSYEDADSWAAKLRLISSRPLDESKPVLDWDLSFGSARARVAVVTQPLSPDGLAFAFRRHRDNPWTLPLFVKNKMLNSFAAGLLSFIIDGSRTILVAGTRSAGKTSLLGSLMLEIISKCRIVVVEDTSELPTEALRKIGYDILRMRVRSALVNEGAELGAAEGIRTSLRLGDSALIVGEVRSEEAKALYEAMRVGALANVVAGTIHGDSPYGVYDRVVNDLGVEKTSFKATDIIIVANPIKSADGMHSMRRIVQVTEVRKHWTQDPMEEGGFVDLLRYNVEKDELEPTDALINGESEIIKSIASKVKGWAGDWDAVFDNITLRGKCKQEVVDASAKLGKNSLLEAEFNAISNSAFQRISDKVTEEFGLPISERVFPIWKEWLYKTGQEY